LFSRSSALMRSRSSVLTPTRVLLSISWRLTHFTNVWVEPPVFGAIDAAAAHSDGDSPCCSCTEQTARSRTSVENLFDVVLLMASFLYL